MHLNQQLSESIAYPTETKINFEDYLFIDIFIYKVVRFKKDSSCVLKSHQIFFQFYNKLINSILKVFLSVNWLFCLKMRWNVRGLGAGRWWKRCQDCFKYSFVKFTSAVTTNVTQLLSTSEQSNFLISYSHRAE